MYFFPHRNAGLLLLNVQESPWCLVARGEQANAPEVLEKIAWMNGKDFPDGVLMTPIDHNTSKSDAASDNGIIELLTQISRSTSKGFSCPSVDALHRIRQFACLGTSE